MSLLRHRRAAPRGYPLRLAVSPSGKGVIKVMIVSRSLSPGLLVVALRVVARNAYNRVMTVPAHVSAILASLAIACGEPPAPSQPAPGPKPPEVQVSASPKPAAPALSRQEVLNEINLLFWQDRLVIEATRYNNLDQCVRNQSDAEKKLEPLLLRAAELKDAAITEALDAMKPCLMCMDGAWPNCWRLPSKLRALGLKPMALGIDGAPKKTGAARDAEVTALRKEIKSTAKKVRAACESHPGDIDLKMKGTAEELDTRAWDLDPYDNDLLFASDRLNGAAECTKNFEKYLHWVSTALERNVVPSG